MDLQMGSQAQVNNELKNMLVASIGEDIEAKIQMLTEDKVLLAHKLLNFTGALAGRQDRSLSFSALARLIYSNIRRIYI